MSSEHLPPDEVRVDQLVPTAGIDPTAQCPACGAPALEIAYGFPTPNTFEAADRGELLLGGCLIDREDPTHGCIRGHRWKIAWRT